MKSVVIIMGITGKFFVYNIILAICLEQFSQANPTCIPLEHCPAILNIVEENRHSPGVIEILGNIRCTHSKTRVFIWCPTSTTQSRNLRFPGPVAINNKVDDGKENYKRTPDSPGYIWGATRFTNSINSHNSVTATPDESTKNSVLSGRRFLPYIERQPTTKPVPYQSENEDRIYFPDEDFHLQIPRQGRSKILDKISSTCGRPFYRSSESSSEEQSAGLGEFPWMALLEYNISGINVPNCAGTLISSRHVLTAANCIHHYNTNQLNFGKLLQVVFGELNTKSQRDCVKTQFGERCGDEPIKYGVESVTIHPLYNGNNDFDDVAILKLEKEVEFSDFVLPICLPEKEFEFEMRNGIVMASWQRYDDKDNYILKKANVDLSGSRINPIDASESCTGFPGNPLMTQISDGAASPFYLVGIDVGGVKSKNCGGTQTASIFVPDFRSWIDENLS